MQTCQCKLISILTARCIVNTSENEPLVIKRRGEDGNRVITVRIKESILADLDRLSSDTQRSRNELINIILEHGLKNVEIK